MSQRKLKLGEMLLAAGIVNEYQLHSALSYQRHWGGRLGGSLIRLGYLTEETLLAFLADQLQLTRVELERTPVREELLALVPAAKAREYNVFPVDRREMSGTVHLLVAMSDPTNLLAIDALQFMTGCQVRPALAAEQAVRSAIDRHYGPPEELDLDEGELPEIEPLEEDADDFRSADPATIFAGGEADEPRPGDLEERFALLLRLLRDKGVLTLREFERLSKQAEG